MAEKVNRIVVVACSVAILALLASVVVGELREHEESQMTACIASAESGHSIARIWNEALLGAIRLDVPSPTVHARNLFHTSAAMWDAWAAYDEAAAGVFLDESAVADDVADARRVAISYAAYGVLVQRYLQSPGAVESMTGFDDLMDRLCLDRFFVDTAGGSPAALGNRIAATILEASLDDGSNERNGYVAPDYAPVNPPLVVARPGTTMIDPNRWQPLELDAMVAQNGMPLSETVQSFVGPHWGAVEPFALARSDDGRPSFDPGPPPLLGDPATDAEFKDAIVEVVEHSALLDPRSGVTIDIGPSSTGNSVLDSYEERGHSVNPVAGEPYPRNEVVLGDYGRVVAEFWADGPSSETPPGHWNTIANTVADALGADRRIAGQGPSIDRLEWDVKLYLALNGAMHDAAVAAWWTKGFYDYARPISMIRHMGGLGQSSVPDGPSFHPDGLPLVADLIEVVSAESSGPAQRHEHLAEHVGEVAVRSWIGVPPDPETEVSGVGWIRSVEWVPYQLPTFVTPAFAGYVSGHSTFSRAGAEVLAAMTGSEFFPGGVGEWTVPAGSLEFEAGPATDVTLQWATFADAADEAGRSRLYGGIHVRADDLAGRKLGQRVGQDAWTLAQEYFQGSVG